jgi:type VI secretion system secreted protein Hcp
MPIYVKYGTIKGSVTESGHTEWVDVGSFQWGVGRAIGSPTGRSANREASAPSISEVTLTKVLDKSSYAWLQECLKGQAVDCEIHFVSTEGDALRKFLTYKLTNCLVSGYSQSSGGDRPSESISINFTKFEMATTEYDDKNKPTDSPKVSYDMATAKTA